MRESDSTVHKGLPCNEAILSLCLAALLWSGCRPAPPAVEQTPVEVVVSEKSPTTEPTGLVQEATATPHVLPTQPTPESVSSVSTSVASTRAKPKSQTRQSVANLPLELPGKAEPGSVDDDELTALLSQAQQTQSAADWRKVAERALVVEDFPSAHQAYRRESEIYSNKGFDQAALAEAMKADLYEVALQLYVSKSFEGPDRTLERLEPPNGCYVGAFIDRDSSLTEHYFASQRHGDIDQFNKLVGKEHASFFMYRAYGHPFPTEWAEYVKSKGAIPHIAWEPSDLAQVADDSYLEQFLAEAERLDHPVMLRFASEMNGEWTAYNGQPEAYIKAFRMVFRESRKAPKVALMWCPNAVPKATIDDYYPGDEYVDWVGVNFYSVPFLDNDPKRSGEKIHPTDHLKYVYQKYSTRKPIAVGEWAASRKSALSEKDLAEFATSKVGQMYATLPTRFPRVKMVNWYDCNNIQQAKQERQLNNFQITGSPQLLTGYQTAVSGSYYLGAGERTSKVEFQPVGDPVLLGPSDQIRLFLKGYDPILKVYFQVGSAVVHASDDPLEWFVTGQQLQPYGKGELKVTVFDSKNRFVGTKRVHIEASKN
jgi:Glycosyl hydrolase family 26